MFGYPTFFETGGEKRRYFIVVTALRNTKSRVVSDRKVPLEIFNAIKGQQMLYRDNQKQITLFQPSDIEETKSEKVAAKIKLINPKAWNTLINEAIVL